jgi:signal transduction histidine kinase
VKTILSQLRPAGLAVLTLQAAIENLVTNWRSRQPDVHFTCEVQDRTFGPRIDNAILGIVREGLSNAMKHAAAQHLIVRVRQCEQCEILVEIEDDGKGITSPEGRGFGIVGMMERAALLGGRLTVTRRNGCGTLVRAQLPVRDCELEEATQRAVQ